MEDAVPSLARLRWRCRRGTRELDRLLIGWLDENGATATRGTLDQFDALLDRQDPDLWDWLSANAAPEPRFVAIVDAIRRR